MPTRHEGPWSPPNDLTRKHYSVEPDPLELATEHVLDMMPDEVASFEGWERQQRKVAREIAEVIHRHGEPFAQRYSAWAEEREATTTALPGIGQSQLASA